MLDINNKKFEKAAFGYKPEDVDSFLHNVSVEFSRLEKEKEDCEKKIDVLADRVREYMKDEDALKDALLGAQRQSRQTVDEAQETAARIVSEANMKADQIIGQTRVQLQKEQQSLAAMQREVAEFKATLLSLYKNHLDLITAMPDSESEAMGFYEEEILEQPSEQQNSNGYGGVTQEQDVHYGNEVSFGSPE